MPLDRPPSRDTPETGTAEITLQEFSAQPLWPGLLPWQHLLCAWILGMLTWEWPLPGATALCLYLAALIGSWESPLHQVCAADAKTSRHGFPPAWFMSPRRTAYAVVPVLLAFFFGVATVHHIHPVPPPAEERPEINHRTPTNITATVAEVRPRPGNHYQIVLRDVLIHPAETATSESPQPLGGGLLWNWQSPPQVPGPGQEVRVALRIRPIQGMANPGMNRSEDFWARQGIYHRAYSREANAVPHYSGTIHPAWEYRWQLREKILAATPPGQGQAMLLALLMGDRSLLAPETMDLVQRASLAHSLALSGMHLGFVVGLGWLGATILGWIRPQLYLRLPRPKLVVLLSIPLVLGYLWLGQAVPSLLRAALMFASWGVLLLLNRQRVLLDGLFLAVLVILLFSPLAVFDLRLQLSVLAVAGLALAWPLGREALRFSQRPWWQKPLAAALGILAVSTVATLALLPLQAWYFGRISPHLYLNILWLPLLGMVVFPMGLIGLLALLTPWTATMASLLLGMASAVLEGMVGGLATLDQAGWMVVTIPARPFWPQILGYWMLLLAAAAWWRSPQSIRPAAMILAIALLVVPGLSTIISEQRPQVTLRLLDVSQGQAVLLELPGGSRWLLDGGGFWSWDYDLGRNVITPVLTHGQPPRLGGIALSHAHFDHYRGLFYPLGHFQVRQFASQGSGPEGRDGQILEDTLARRTIPTAVWHKGDEINLGRGIHLEVLHPGPEWLSAANQNNASLVLRLVWNGRPLALLPGDIELPSIAALLQNISAPDALRAEVLILPHHGSRTSHSPQFYTMVQPDVALVSTGFLNRFNHPHPEVRQSLAKQSIALLNTATHGAVSIRWNGPNSQPVITSERAGRIDVHGMASRHEEKGLPSASGPSGGLFGPGL
ncbi:DNA internalization-related competence protein ComEC/Rec2 [Desulfonatronum thioautotrophicum]|uniref:DNA internalization-related competence protein ComEC/Rec2 n=1 Tax=Desulfonatronum thioautotrophicum TaxID=617001 RepID=UPI00069C7C2C|nr:DNA internalization-related competence protein ComEC/Rec2 [Desulfonatronum thioautotrophicum]